MIIEYVTWWYSRGLLRFFKYCRAYIVILADAFSLKVAISTFFAPWKKDSTPTQGQSLDVKFRIWGFNLIARGFGMIIKFFTTIVFLLVFLILVILEIIAFIVWLAFPFLIVEMFLLGFFYLLGA
ncbi:MAG: hypothetical protein HQ530_01795 [Parcubacteria group bacterium]|nr:hypothetical protein [Parcubacteria group bacterium]